MSQAAESFSLPSPAAKRGIDSSPTWAAISSASAVGTTGLVKNEPADQVSWSAASSTMPLARRVSNTEARASAKGTRFPPKWRRGMESSVFSSCSSISSTTAREVNFRLEYRYARSSEEAGTHSSTPVSRSQSRTRVSTSAISAP